MKKIKFSKVWLSAFLSVALVFSLTGCDELMGQLSGLLDLNGQDTNQNGDDDNSGENTNPGGTTNPDDGTNPGGDTQIIAPYTKTASTFTSGKRSINISDKKNGTGVILALPTSKPEYL